MLLDQYFEQSAKNHPNSVAIEHGDIRFTYAKADLTANRLAHFLRGKGVGIEDKVVILFPRRAEVTVSMIGVLKAGAAYIPLDPEIPAERVNFIMEDSAAKLLITSDEILERIGNQLQPFPVFNIDKQLDQLTEFSSDKPMV